VAGDSVSAGVRGRPRRGDRSAGATCLRSLAVAVLPVVVAALLLSGCGPGESGGSDGVARRPEENSGEWGEPQGRWHNSGWMEVEPEEERGLTVEQRREFARLRSLGYLPGSSPIPANTGVVVYDGRSACDGLNFHTSGHAPVAVLTDMEGRRLHRWRMSFEDAWNEQPGDSPPASIKSAGYWRRARLLEDGSVLAIFEGLGLIKVDAESRLVWARFGGFHHDLDVNADGLIYVLTREPRIIPEIHAEMPILEDFVAILDADGNELRRVSVLEAFRGTQHEWFLDRAERHGDILHTNTVELLDGRLAGRVPAFAAGNVLVTVRELGVIAVVDLDAGEVVWSMDGGWVKPHQATVLENGNLLIFDNRGNEGRSQVLEFDPVTGEVVWSYRGDTPDDFYSWECGSCERLPNGNTLMTESDRGKAFEVTADGTLVWKFLNPMRAGDDLEFIATLFELVRLPEDFPDDWLDGGGDGRNR